MSEPGSLRLTIDTDTRTLLSEEAGKGESWDLYSPEAFRVLSRLWLKVGWALRYTYSFTWMGRPIIQLPEDMVRVQEIIFRVRPDVIVETGVAHGGSLVFYASLLKTIGVGRVIGVDVEIRKHNRKAIEEHPLFQFITLVEGDSVSAATLDRVRNSLRPEDRVFVMLDSNHSRKHVRAELEAYAPFVTPGSYIVVADGITADLADVPGGRAEWDHDNPLEAIGDFLAEHKEFVGEEPAFAFNEGRIKERYSYWPAAYMRRLERP